MFFRKGEKLLLVIFVLIMVFAMSGCGIVGELLEKKNIGELIEENGVELNGYLTVGDSTEVTDGEANLGTVIIQDGHISVDGYESNTAIIDLTDAMYEKVGFDYAVVGGAEKHSEPSVNSGTVELLSDGEAVLIYFQTEAEGILWGRTDGGWLRMVDIACVH